MERDARRLSAGGRLEQLVLDTAPLVVVVVNRQRQIILGNRHLEALSPLKLERMVGLRLGETLDCEHAAERPGGCGTTAFCSRCGAVRAILSGLKGTEDVQECRLTRRDGRALDLRVWTRPMEVDGDRFALFMAQDISDEKRREALERAFFHDVLNTAGAALGWARLDDRLPPEAAAAGRARLPGIIRRLIDEIHGQRDLLALEQARYRIELTTVDGARLLCEVADDWSEHDCARGKEIEVEAGALELVTDRTLLRRVLANMVKNALEASAEGDRITLRCAADGENARFSVHNRAVMPREVQLQLFQRSFSTKGPGRGLGTYSMRLLSERFLGGRVTFASTEEAGTTFTASYPLRPESR